jgi:hypothetical protein
LNKGEYVDDPVYIELLLTQDNFLNLREKFLKEYFSGKSKLGNNTLLKTYLDRGGDDIIEQMKNDGIFYKYDTETGKEISRMFNDYFNEVDEEEIADDPSRIDRDDIEEEELSVNSKPTLQSIIQENMNTLKEGQEMLKQMRYEDKKSVDKSSDVKYSPGRQKSNNKKMKYKH